MSIAFGDARTFPATQQAKTIMKQLVTKGIFHEQGDVWRLGAALGIALDRDLKNDNRGTFQNINSLDPDQVFAAMMVGLHPNFTPEERVKKLVDHAEWGIREISRKVKNDTLDFSTLGLSEYIDGDKPETVKPKATEIEELLKCDESAILEFKSSFRWDTTFNKINEDLIYASLKTIVGYLNSKKGGVLLIGVDPEHNIFGMDKDYESCKPPNKDGLEQLIMRKISDNIGVEFATDITVEFQTINGKDVCKVKVPPATSPSYLADKSKVKTFYLRVGNSTNPLTVEAANKYCLERFK